MIEHGIETAEDVDIGVSIEPKHRTITIRFTSPVSWIMLSDSQAESFAKVILRKLNEIENENNRTTTETNLHAEN